MRLEISCVHPTMKHATTEQKMRLDFGDLSQWHTICEHTGEVVRVFFNTLMKRTKHVDILAPRISVFVMSAGTWTESRVYVNDTLDPKNTGQLIDLEWVEWATAWVKSIIDGYAWMIDQVNKHKPEVNNECR